MDTHTNKYTHRYLARVIIEATTPLAIGSGEKNMITDQIILSDVNGLPYIPGTSLAGIIRHALGEEISIQFFGTQGAGNKDGKGSEIIFTSAQLVNETGDVIDGIISPHEGNDFIKNYKALPIRQHVRIGSDGSAVKNGKFDKQVIYKGSRFCFEMEMVSDGSNFILFEKALSQLSSQGFRIGGGTRSGLGEIKVISWKRAILDLKLQQDLNRYLQKSSSLSNTLFWENYPEDKITSTPDSWIAYELKLKPDDFFLFGSGFGDEEADMTPVSESQVIWEEGRGSFVKNNILIPATSVKGAISHRVAFYYNQINGVFADQINDETDTAKHTGSKNKAVRDLFGTENMDNPQRGYVLISDIIEKRNNSILSDKIINHVSIDRFTGGASEGALFTEKVTYAGEQVFILNIKVAENILQPESQKAVKTALQRTLRDICNGMLPLGGGTNRGHGCFSGTITYNNGEELSYE